MDGRLLRPAVARSPVARAFVRQSWNAVTNALWDVTTVPATKYLSSATNYVDSQTLTAGIPVKKCVTSASAANSINARQLPILRVHAVTANKGSYAANQRLWNATVDALIKADSARSTPDETGTTHLRPFSLPRENTHLWRELSSTWQNSFVLRTSSWASL